MEDEMNLFKIGVPNNPPYVLNLLQIRKWKSDGKMSVLLKASIKCIIVLLKSRS